MQIACWVNNDRPRLIARVKKMFHRTSLKRWIAAGCITATTLSGCKPVDRFRAWTDNKNTSYFQEYITRIEYPDVRAEPDLHILQTPLPLSIENPSDLPTIEITLQEAITAALQTSDVLRNLGGTVVAAPQAQATELDPALIDVNPLGGVEAALSEFDAVVNSQLFWQKNERPINRPNLPEFELFFPLVNQQTTGNFINQVSKRTAQGAQYALRTNVVYDRNNNPSRRFPSDFVGFIEAEWRQPLMQGAGTTYNRIAGPNARIGQYNGVLIARINTDISLADFEAGVIGLINDVETAYWELYFAYRQLEAQVLGRESSLKTWQRVNELQKVGQRGGEADAEAQARSNFYLFSAQLNDALAGPNGLYAAEQRLRYMMGKPPSDGSVLKPKDEPMQAQVLVDWESAVVDALTRRVEIRRQEWIVKRREFELVAARLNKRPRMDALMQYRFRGLGDHLIGNRDPNNRFDNLFHSIMDKDFQEWQAGLEWSYNVGLRQASAAVRHAQLQLAREMAVLKEQQLRITHDLSNASREMARSHLQMETNYNRVEADKLQVDVLRNRYERGLININFLLQAQQQLATSTSAFYRSLVDYNLAMRDFHREKGSLLAYNQVNLFEEPLDGAQLSQAFDRGRYFTPRDNSSDVQTGPAASEGGFDPSSVGVPQPQ